MANVPAGNYVFMAKTTVVQLVPDAGSGANSSATIFTRCTLNGNPDTNVDTDDYGESEPGRGAAAEVGRATIHTQVTLNLVATTSITLRCRYRNNGGGATSVVARESKIIRINVGATTRTAVTG